MFLIDICDKEICILCMIDSSETITSMFMFDISDQVLDIMGDISNNLTIICMIDLHDQVIHEVILCKQATVKVNVLK